MNRYQLSCQLFFISICVFPHFIVLLSKVTVFNPNEFVGVIKPRYSRSAYALPVTKLLDMMREKTGVRPPPFGLGRNHVSLS